MRKLSVLMAAVAATFAMSSAQALVLVVDTFDNPAISLFDTAGGDLANAAYSDSTRTIYHELVTPVPSNDGSFSGVKLGNNSFPTGNLQMSNADTVTSKVSLNWSLAPGFVPATGPVSFYFRVYTSDSVTKNISASIGANSIGGFAINQVTAPGTTIYFPVNAGDQALLAAGGTLGMTFVGDLGWDISIDEIGFIIPEPTSLALAGLALLGAGLASRRRKAA